MNLSRLCGAILTLLFLTIRADANPSTLYTLSYNFPIDGNGGGAAATLNNVNIEIFCDDFAHQIWVPYGPPTYPGYTVNVSSLSSGSNLSLTRFGGVTSWTSVNIAGDAADSNTINNANALARYQMAAYLTMQYHMSDSPTNDPYNNGIQEAIWTLLDPAVAGVPQNIGSPTVGLQQAAQWYANPNSNKSFLTDFRIISDTAMQTCGTGPTCGFQEQLFDPMPMPTVPEPRGQLLVILGLLSLCAFKYQRSWTRS
jgi:hypothetical protein